VSENSSLKAGFDAERAQVALSYTKKLEEKSKESQKASEAMKQGYETAIK
jgi:hypothetical protein